MKLPLKAVYACQVLAQLGRTYGHATLPHIEVLAEAENIPANYLVQILNELRTRGLIHSRRGKQGGYALQRSPDKINLAEVMAAVDGGLLSLPEGTKGVHSSSVLGVWSKLQANLSDEATKITIADLMVVNEGTMWHI